MKYGVLIIACLLLASCATMKNGSTRPTEEIGSCGGASYDSAKIGEKEILAGTILLPSGLALSTLGMVLVPGGILLGNEDAFIAGTVMLAIGPLALIASVVTLIDGNLRVNKWNDSCVGSTAAERYCLFEPLPISSGETP